MILMLLCRMNQVSQVCLVLTRYVDLTGYLVFTRHEDLPLYLLHHCHCKRTVTTMRLIHTLRMTSSMSSSIHHCGSHTRQRNTCLAHTVSLSVVSIIQNCGRTQPRLFGLHPPSYYWTRVGARNVWTRPWCAGRIWQGLFGDVRAGPCCSNSIRNSELRNTVPTNKRDEATSWFDNHVLYVVDMRLETV